MFWRLVVENLDVTTISPMSLFYFSVYNLKPISILVGGSFIGPAVASSDKLVAIRAQLRPLSDVFQNIYKLIIRCIKMY